MIEFIKNLFKRRTQLNMSDVSVRSEQLFCPNCGKSEIRENFWDETKLVCNDCWCCWTK